MATSRLCSVPDCGKPAVNSRGWCNAHYLRWRRYGDPLAGRTPEGEPLRFLREVVLAYDGDECLLWPFATSGGYGYIRFDGHAQRVTRIICEHVHGPAPTPHHEAAHSCGKGHDGCCTKRHLSWKTAVDNQADKILHGTTNRGERQGGAKLSAEQVREIRALKGKMPQREIAEAFGICPQNVGLIHLGKRWAHL